MFEKKSDYIVLDIETIPHPDVAFMWEAGKLDEIADYCKNDVMWTEKIYRDFVLGSK
jgi:hypothetical protein